MPAVTGRAGIVARPGAATAGHAARLARLLGEDVRGVAPDARQARVSLLDGPRGVEEGGRARPWSAPPATPAVSAWDDASREDVL